MTDAPLRRLPVALSHLELHTVSNRGNLAAPSAPSPHAKLRRSFAFLVMVALGVGLAFYAWTAVLKVPAERPFSGVYDEGRQLIGWAPWWIAPLISGALAAAIAVPLLRPSHQPTPHGTLVRALLIAWGAIGVASFVRNAGHVLLNVKGAGIEILIASLPQMVIFHLGSAPQFVFLEGHWLFPLAALAAAAICLLAAGRLDTLWRTTAGPREAMNAPLTSNWTRWISATAIGVLTTLPFLPVIGGLAFAAAVIVAAVWAGYGFPGGAFCWLRLVAIGSLAPMAAAAPFVFLVLPVPELVLSMSAASLLPSFVFSMLVAGCVRLVVRKATQ